MSAVTDLLLTWVSTYGIPVFALALLIGAAGIPIPTTLLVLASGAFSRQGILNAPLTGLVGLAGVVMGDSLSYAMGHFARGWVLSRFGSSAVWQRATKLFLMRGSWAIYLSRFLLTSIAIPTNLIAGSSSYSFKRFLVFDLVGEVTWLVLYGSLGYLFSTQWEAISDLISNFGGLILGALVLVVGIILALRYQRRNSAESSSFILLDRIAAFIHR